MSPRTLLLFLAISCCNLKGIFTWRPFKFNFTGLEITYNPMVGKGGGVIRIDSTGHTVVDFFYESNMRLFGPLYMNVLASTRTMNVNRPIKINVTGDICEVFKKPRMPPIVRGIYTEITSRMDMPLRCPIEPKMYHILGAGKGAEEEFPPYLPFATYNLCLRIFQTKKATYTHVGTIIIKVIVTKNNEKRPKRVLKAPN